MSKPKFTPGPWKAEYRILDDMTFAIVVDESRKTICEVFSHEPNWEDEQEANATLIKNAPELYEACRFHCETRCKMRNLNKNICKNCLYGKALRKARGESEENHD